MTNKKGSTTSVWKTLTTSEVKVAVDEHRQQKGKLDYLSWAWAWGKLKDHFPDASFEKHWFEDGTSRIPFTCDQHGYAYVQVTVTVEGSSLTEILPVLNHNNKPVTNPDSFEVNTALQRCLCKAIAYHGLGFHIYAGEDLEDYTPDNPVVVEKIEDTLTIKKNKSKNGKELVQKAKDIPIVKAVEKELNAEIATVIDSENYRNTYDKDGSLIHGFNDENLTFIMEKSMPIPDQLKYIYKHISSILQSITTIEDLTQLLANNSALIHRMAKHNKTTVANLKLVALIKEHKSQLQQ